jgi:hypothetical protein
MSNLNSLIQNPVAPKLANQEYNSAFYTMLPLYNVYSVQCFSDTMLSLSNAPLFLTSIHLAQRTTLTSDFVVAHIRNPCDHSMILSSTRVPDHPS